MKWQKQTLEWNLISGTTHTCITKGGRDARGRSWASAWRAPGDVLMPVRRVLDRRAASDAYARRDQQRVQQRLDANARHLDHPSPVSPPRPPARVGQLLRRPPEPLATSSTPPAPPPKCHQLRWRVATSRASVRRRETTRRSRRSTRSRKGKLAREKSSFRRREASRRRSAV